jgi:hypothetical protein
MLIKIALAQLIIVLKATVSQVLLVVLLLALVLVVQENQHLLE